MYLIRLPSELMRALWKLREEHGKGPIAQQVREAVATCVEREKEKLS